MMVETANVYDVVGYVVDGFRDCFWVMASQNKELLNARPILINPAHVRYIDGNKIAMDNGINWFVTDKALHVLRNLTSYELLFGE